MTEIGSTLPASYELMFLDGPTYDANAEGFAETRRPVLNRLSFDGRSDVAGERADPYAPAPGKPATPRRAPTISSAICRPTASTGACWPPAARRRRVSSRSTLPSRQALDIRGDPDRGRGPQGRHGGGAGWSRVAAGYVPDPHAIPSADTLGPGDGVIAAWSAAPARQPEGGAPRRRQVDDMDLMNDALVQAAIADILLQPGARPAGLDRQDGEARRRAPRRLDALRRG